MAGTRLREIAHLLGTVATDHVGSESGSKLIIFKNLGAEDLGSHLLDCFWGKEVKGF